MSMNVKRFALAAAVGLSSLGFADEPKKLPPDVTAIKEQILRLEKEAGTDAVKLFEVVKMKEKLTKLEKERDELLQERNKPAPVARVALPDDVPAAPRVVVGVGNDLRAQYERQMKEFEEAIKKAPDAEAKEQLENTRDEYKKAMADALTKADEANKQADQGRPRFAPGLAPLAPAPFARQRADDQDLERMLKLQADMHKQLLEQLKGMENLLGPDEKLLLQMLQGPDDKLLQQLLQGQGDLRGLLVPVARNPAAPPPRLGVRVDKVQAVLIEQLDLPKDSGVVLVEVFPGSAADKAGLKVNDVLVRLGDKDVPTDPEAFIAMVGKIKGGEKIDAVVYRKGKKEAVKGIDLPEAKPALKPFVNPLDGGRGGIGGRNEQVQMQVNGDNVASLTATIDGVGYEVHGALKNGKLSPARIVVTEGKETTEYDTLEKVPEGHRGTIERLLVPRTRVLIR